jgi:hypothetical protein
MASTYLSRTQSASSTRTKCTLSAWIKRGKFNNSAYHFFVSSYISNSDRMGFYFNTGDTLDIYSPNFHVATNRVFRDPNAWLHVVYRIDTTHGNASDRIRIYVNGELQTSLGQTSYPTQNYNLEFGTSSHNMYIGNYDGSQHYFDGSMSHVHFLDGEDRDASYFGETDATTGEWKIKTNVTGVNYGTNGFAILKDGNTITDQSSNSNNFTLGGGTLTKTEDCPSNVFCTLNRLNSDQPTGSVNIQYGNTGFEDGENGSNFSYVSGTLGANSGKFYWETKVIDLAEIDQVGVALASSNFMGAANSNGLQATTYGGKGCQFSNGYKVGDGSGGAYMGGFSANDIMMIALDLDNNKITFGRNGQWADGSGNANQTYANSTPAYTNLTAGEFYFPAQAKRAYGANYGTNWYNFGNGYFQTTAVSSAGTNASGNGIFEYDVPSGFTALSTKGLNL